MNEVARARMVLASEPKRLAYDEELLGRGKPEAEPEIRASALTRLATTQQYDAPVEQGIRGVAEPVAEGESLRPASPAQQAKEPPVHADDEEHEVTKTDPADVIASLAASAPSRAVARQTGAIRDVDWR